CGVNRTISFYAVAGVSRCNRRHYDFNKLREHQQHMLSISVMAKKLPPITPGKQESGDSP
ncbi:MAG TPA: hypothetical protein VFD56_04130, partial [Chitinophagaceae bacterium]|nr:hypothetical protein [Chitinophagaceae bacterium]